MPTSDKGFEESFREYLYNTKIKFDLMSDARDLGLGLSYSTLSDNPHELDVICQSDKDLFIFELKHYEVSDITKEIIFTFLGKVLDFYLKNAEILSNYKITMFLITINKDMDDSIRKLCIAFGIKLLEPSLMTLGTLDYFGRDLYQKIPDNDALKSEMEKLLVKVSTLKEKCDFSFSDLFRYKNGKIEIEPMLVINPTDALNKIEEYYDLFGTVNESWKLKRN